VTTPANVVVFVQMRFVGGTGNPEDAAAYEAIRSSGSDKKVIFPRIEREPYGTTYASTVGIQNLSQSATANVTLTYYKFTYCTGASTITVSFTIAPNGSLLRNHRIGDDIPIGWCGSLVATSSNNAIAGYAQVTKMSSPLGSGDNFMAYNAVTRP
jgi:hypothetical protein